MYPFCTASMPEYDAGSLRYTVVRTVILSVSVLDTCKVTNRRKEVLVIAIRMRMADRQFERASRSYRKHISTSLILYGSSTL
jgi:hypothetical protein